MFASLTAAHNASQHVQQHPLRPATGFAEMKTEATGAGRRDTVQQRMNASQARSPLRVADESQRLGRSQF